MQPCNMFSGNLYQPMVKWGVDRQACRKGGPHLGVERAQGSWETHMSELGHRWRDGAEEGAVASVGRSEEVVWWVQLFGTVEPLQLG